MKLSDLVFKSFVLSDFDENCYVVHIRGAKECVVVDPGPDAGVVLEYLRANALVPVAVLITHGHCDHFAGLSELKAEWSEAKVYVGENEAYKLSDPVANLSAPFGFPHVQSEYEVTLRDGEEFTVANLTFKTLETPGHSVGHVLYQLTLEDAIIVFCGDLVFKNAVGRADFADGDHMALFDSIKSKLLTLPDSTYLLPGHGSSTTVGRERLENPFLRKL